MVGVNEKMGMIKYTIDYGWSTAQFWCPPDKAENVLRLFGQRANDCFGIRKSITKDPTITDAALEELPDWAPEGSAVAMQHGGGDTIAWGADGKKTLDEWGDRHSAVEP